ncbi:MAG: response regulator [Chitinivibrionales bacterium]|nr:response regulator [Chitinivibrionales bacterium]
MATAVPAPRREPVSFVRLLHSNVYFFVMLLTVAYSLTFILFLTARYQCSQTARRFILFLAGVILWSMKDALGEMLLPAYRDNAAEYLRVITYISPLFLGMPMFGLNMLMSVYNGSISPRRRFRYMPQANIALGVLLLGIYIASLIEPHVLYGTLHLTEHSYHFTPGPGMYAFALAVIASALLPALMLFGVAWRKWRSEACYIAVGSVFTLAAALATNLFASLWGLEQLPRLGCLSVSVFSLLTFIGIVRHGGQYKLSRILQEREKFRLIAAGMEGLLDVYDEDTIYSQICDHARETSESSLVSILFLLEGDRTYEVKASSLRNRPADVLGESDIPLAPRAVYDMARLPGIKRLLDSRAPLVMRSSKELFGERPSDEASLLGTVRQVVCYPIVHENLLRGILLLVRDTVETNTDLFRIFGVQSALVLKFSWQIAELEKMRRLEEQLHRAQKMEAIGQLAGGIAHDFNNTLSGITGYAQLIRRKFADSQAGLKEYIDAIIGAARRSADLTEKLLAYARKGKLQAVPVDLHAVINESMQILEPTLDKRIEIATRFDASTSVVMGDPSQLQNIIVNLAINARNAMPKGGELTIATETVTHDRAQPVANEYEIRPGAYVVLSVTDTGIGMDSETQRRVFEPFFTTDETGKGSGLGLPSVYGMVKSHKGFITVDSELGTGTTFKVYLPMLKTQTDGSQSLTGPTRRKTEQLVKGHGHVLVVDDDELICRLSKEMLTFLGYSTTVVRSGAEAVEYFGEHPDDVDVAIVDIMMPQMDGYETYHELRRIRPDVKVILTTGYSLPRDTRHMASLGLCGFLQKPFESSALSQVLHDIIADKPPYGRAPHGPRAGA